MKHHQNERGFSTIEFLIYFSIMTFISCLAVHAWWHLQTALGTHTDYAIHSINLCSAHDLIVRDLLQAEPQMTTWKFEASSFVWRVASYDVGWELIDKKLFRSQGLFDYYAATWRSRTRCLIADALDELNLVTKCTQGCVSQVKSLCACATIRDERTTHLRNRVI